MSERFASDKYRFYLREHLDGTATVYPVVPKLCETVEYFQDYFYANKQVKLNNKNWTVERINLYWEKGCRLINIELSNKVYNLGRLGNGVRLS